MPLGSGENLLGDMANGQFVQNKCHGLGGEPVP